MTSNKKHKLWWKRPVKVGAGVLKFLSMSTLLLAMVIVAIYLLGGCIWLALVLAAGK